MAVFNPVDYLSQDLIVIHAGTYLGTVNDGKSIGLKTADIAKIKGGVVATLTAANEFGVSDGTATLYPFGLFLGDASKSPNEVSVVFRGGLYESKNWDKTETLSGLAINTVLTCTSDGLLEPLGMQSKIAVGIVTKQPADTSDTLGIKLII